MVLARSQQKVEKLTVTLIPQNDERTPLHIPSTFNTSHRAYDWCHTARMDYMIVPTRISSNEVRVDVFVTPVRGGRMQPKDLQRAVESFVQAKLVSEWKGLRLAGIGRPTSAAPPKRTFVRGTIEEMLSTPLDQ
jgi:hypothetical protein